MQRIHDRLPSEVSTILAGLNAQTSDFIATGQHWSCEQLATLFLTIRAIKKSLMREGYELIQLKAGQYTAHMTKDAVDYRGICLVKELLAEEIPADFLLTPELLTGIERAPSLKEAKKIVMNRVADFKVGRSKHVFFPPPLVEQIIEQSKKLTL
jgi:hypothetical protein